MKKRLLNGDVLEFINNEDHVLIWFQKRTSNFCFQLNGKVIKATKVFKLIDNLFKSIDDLVEVNL